ncbi:MarR family winged helix-turn-helix transcriptional regulator [Mucilaginibacter terrae]|uniref:MarR family winged helix-turn-helix transcriptional regulator n=1 Tax=Mucilaginibacter terrae TaxID=1955052 RepID=UPI00363CBDB9
MKKTIDERLFEFEKKHENNWQHIIYNLRKHMDFWTTKNVNNPSGKIKHSYLPVLFGIRVNGSTATQIAKRSVVIKQNISRTIKELESIGMVTTRVNKKDKRSDRLDLTPEAKEFILEAHLKVEELQDTYKKLVGERDLEIAKEVVLKIIAYHESLNETNDDTDDEI